MKVYAVELKYPSGYVYRATVTAIDFDDAVVKAKYMRHEREVLGFNDAVRENPHHHPIRILSVTERGDAT